MRQIKLYMFIAVILFLMPATGMAQLRIGYMDPQKVLDALPEAGKVKQELQAYVAQKQQEYNTKYQDFQNRAISYQNRKASLNDAADKAAQDSLQSMSQELSTLQQGFKSDYQQKSNTLMSPILDSVNTAMSEVAKSMHLDFVLNASTADGTIISYVSDKGKVDYDITQKVIDKLTKK